jgi:hypothetical protein
MFDRYCAHIKKQDEVAIKIVKIRKYIDGEKEINLRTFTRYNQQFGRRETALEGLL